MPSPLVVTDLVSAHVLRGVPARYGSRGMRWLGALPVTVACLLDRHRLSLEGPLGGGALSAVLAVTTADGVPAVLKVHPAAGPWAAEQAALTAWSRTAAAAGLPAVTPDILAVDAAAHATVMTRLVPGTQLRKTPVSTGPQVATEAAALAPLFHVLASTPAHDRLEPLPHRIAQAARAAVTAAVEHPTLARHLAGLDWLTRAADGHLPLTPATGTWAHGDLIPNNVLAHAGRWRLLDPLPVAGEVASDLAFLAVMRRAGAGTAALVDAYATAAGVDADRVAAYTRLWAADRLRVAVTHGFFGPAEWADLARVAHDGPVT